MKTIQAHRCAAGVVSGALLCALGSFAAADTPAVGNTQSQATGYEQMARLREYLMEPDAEIALARSAAPAAISGKATILILKPAGYETADKGTNGFTCL